MLGSQRELLWRPIRFMPLIKSPSKTARNKKIKTEIAARKPPKQAVAIGYAVQRRARAKTGAS